MKAIFLVVSLFVCGGVFAQETHPGGIVYGPKAAFKIDAPPGWVLDNKAGAQQGLPCVLYPKGSTWADANAIMYAKIAGTDYEDVGKFVAMAIKQMEKVHGKPKEKVDSGKTGDDQQYFINEYPATKSYSQWERVAYIQLPKAVAYIVFSARDEASYRKNFPALNEARIIRLHEGRRRSQTALKSPLKKALIAAEQKIGKLIGRQCAASARKMRSSA
jgi:hypothetical protein